MRLPCYLVVPLAQYFAIAYNDGADRRIRAGKPQAVTGKPKRMLHPMLICHFLHAGIVSGNNQLSRRGLGY
jgi:hypothetical protein